MSYPPIWIGTMRSIVNCSSGRISMATSVLVFVPFFGRPVAGGEHLLRPAVARGGVDPGDGAVNVQHAGSHPEKEQYDHPPWARADPVIDRPAHRSRNADRDHQLDADTEAEADTLLQSRAVGDHRLPASALRLRLVDPLAELRQRIRRSALAHSCNQTTPAPGRFAAEARAP